MTDFKTRESIRNSGYAMQGDGTCESNYAYKVETYAIIEHTTVSELLSLQCRSCTTKRDGCSIIGTAMKAGTGVD